jgi:hypothetical protein
VELAILELLERHQRGLAYEQITALFHERPYGVRAALGGLCQQGLVESAATGEVTGASTNGITRWQLTRSGREELTQWMAD